MCVQHFTIPDPVVDFVGLLTISDKLHEFRIAAILFYILHKINMHSFTSAMFLNTFDHTRFKYLVLYGHILALSPMLVLFCRKFKLLMYIYIFHPIKNKRLNNVALYILGNYAEYFYIVILVQKSLIWCSGRL
jgi:hypothetical protein